MIRHRLFSLVLVFILILSLIPVFSYNVSAQVNEKDFSRGIKTGNIYDFSSGAGVDKWAYYGTDANGVPPAIAQGTLFPSYTEISSSDNTRYSTGGGSASADPYHLFKFTISEAPATITNLTLSWEGYNDAGTSNFYIWNFGTSAWELLGSHTQIAADGTVTVSKTTDISNYINATTQYLYICAIEITNSGTTIYTDYVYIMVTSKSEVLANFTFSLKPGWNLITLSVYNASLNTAEQLSDAIPSQYVRRYNSSSQNWEMHERNKTENNFQLENGTGYFVYLETEKDFMIEGKEVPGVEINLSKGWNSIGWYENNATYPKKIMDVIVNSSSISYWNATLSRFVVCCKGVSMSNFSISEGTGLFIHAETDSMWDTLPTIFSVEHDAASVLGTSDKFNVTLKGDKGYTAKFDIGSAVTGITLTEESPGVYKGSYTVETGCPSGTYNIIGHLFSEKYTDSMDAPTTVTIDTAAPAEITNLAATPSTTSGTNVTLTWVAPGDDGNSGTASSYDIRYYSSAITESNWASATQCTGEPAPKAAGSSETFTVTSLTEGTTYYFAIKTADEVPNWSPISNSPNAKPSVAPAAITNLATSSPTENSITLTWTAPGDDGSIGTASSYDIRYSTAIIDTDAKFNSATNCTGEPAPKSAGSAESFTVTGLSASTTYYFAIKTADEVPNWSPISNSPSGATSAPPDTILPNVTSTTPANDATGVAVTTTIVVQFSEAMNKTNTEGAFSTSPATTGTFTWNAAGDKMTYTPSTSLSYSTTYTVSITNSATDLAGNKLDGNGNGVVDNPASKDTYTFSFTTAVAPDTTAPAAISNLAATPSTTSGTNVTLTWTAPGDDGNTGTATTYDIRYSSSIIDTDTKFNSATQCTGEPAPKAAGGSETFTVTGLTEGITYYFAIKTGDEVPNWSPLSNSPNAKPSVAPAAITNLATSSPTENSITLTWTAPGDDGNTGTASSYDIRYYSSAITDSNWASATQCTGEPAPKSAGSSESFTVTGLSSSTTYYFAIKTADEVPNWSLISNSPSGTTSAPSDTILPNVTSTTPANSATGVAVTTTIAVQFSEAMNKANTEGAFSTSPATAGIFSWNAAGDKMTYTPSASLTGGTLYTVTITTAATDLAGNPLDGDGDGVQDTPASKDNYVFSFTTAGGDGGTVNKYAVIVGISDYKAISDLSYCDEDASDWYNYLKGQGYTSWVYGDGHTSNYPKYDGYATEYNVKAAINNMISLADSNDIIAYIDSGHGTTSAGKALCCMWDYSSGENGEDGALKNSELQALFNGVNCGGIFIFLDTCNSGGMNGVMSNANANMVYMATTCTSSGYGYDDSTSKNGLWTEYFLNKGLVGGQSGHTDMEGNFQWAHDNYPKSGADEPQQFDGDTSTLFYLSGGSKSYAPMWDSGAGENDVFTEYFLNKGLRDGESGQDDMEGNFDWVSATYPYSVNDAPQTYDGNTSKLLYLKD